MEWNHLPVAGGLYDQHPRFLEDMMLLMEIDNRTEMQKQKQREAKAAAGRNKRGR